MPAQSNSSSGREADTTHSIIQFIRDAIHILVGGRAREANASPRERASNGTLTGTVSTGSGTPTTSNPNPSFFENTVFLFFALLTSTSNEERDYDSAPCKFMAHETKMPWKPASFGTKKRTRDWFEGPIQALIQKWPLNALIKLRLAYSNRRQQHSYFALSNLFWSFSFSFITSSDCQQETQV